VVEPVAGGRLDAARRAARARMEPLGEATAAVLAG